MNKKREIEHLKSEIRRLQECTRYYITAPNQGDALEVSIKDVLDMMLKHLNLKLKRSPEKIELKKEKHDIAEQAKV